MLEVVQNEEKGNIDLGPLTEVIKRDGEKHAFDASKIALAITRAGEATNEFGSDEAWLLTRQVIKVLKHKFAFESITHSRGNRNGVFIKFSRTPLLPVLLLVCRYVFSSKFSFRVLQ